MKIDQIKESIETYKSDLNQAKWEVDHYGEQIEIKKKELRNLLGCKKGEEKKALRSLRSKIENDKQKVETLLERVDENRNRKVQSEE